MRKNWCLRPIVSAILLCKRKAIDGLLSRVLELGVVILHARRVVVTTISQSSNILGVSVPLVQPVVILAYEHEAIT